jgi:predicted DCC family thiol-disulfide oxidoreductase YuxK
MSKSNAVYELEVFYDGGCPLCCREINMLRRRDRQRRIRFTDINAEAFSAGSVGRTHEQLMSAIQARQPDGAWIEGIEVFRRLYAAAGFARLVRFSRWPAVAAVLEYAYRIFARNRLRLTARCADGRCENKVTKTRGARV